MAHIARTHRCNLDWLLERSIRDPCIFCRYIETSQQLADILTKSHFSVSTWLSLCAQFRLGLQPKKEARALGKPGLAKSVMPLSDNPSSPISFYDQAAITQSFVDITKALLEDPSAEQAKSLFVKAADMSLRMVDLMG